MKRVIGAIRIVTHGMAHIPTYRVYVPRLAEVEFSLAVGSIVVLLLSPTKPANGGCKLEAFCETGN